MSKKNRKQKIGHNKKSEITREQKRLHSLADLAGTIIDKEQKPEEKPKTIPDMPNISTTNKEDAWNGW
jgi:hypothetical protein